MLTGRKIVRPSRLQSHSDVPQRMQRRITPHVTTKETCHPERSEGPLLSRNRPYTPTRPVPARNSKSLSRQHHAPPKQKNRREIPHSVRHDNPAWELNSYQPSLKSTHSRFVHAIRWHEKPPIPALPETKNTHSSNPSNFCNLAPPSNPCLPSVNQCDNVTRASITPNEESAMANHKITPIAQSLPGSIPNALPRISNRNNTSFKIRRNSLKINPEPNSNRNTIAIRQATSTNLVPQITNQQSSPDSRRQIANHPPRRPQTQRRGRTPAANHAPRTSFRRELQCYIRLLPVTNLPARHAGHQSQITNHALSNRHTSRLESAVTSSKQTTGTHSNRQFLTDSARNIPTKNHDTRSAPATFNRQLCRKFSPTGHQSRITNHHSPATNHKWPLSDHAVTLSFQLSTFDC